MEAIDIVLIVLSAAVVIATTVLTSGAIIRALINKPEAQQPAMVLFSGITGAITAFVLFFVMVFAALSAGVMMVMALLLIRWFGVPW